MKSVGDTSTAAARQESAPRELRWIQSDALVTAHEVHATAITLDDAKLEKYRLHT